jgi:hypothetical protein
MMMIGSMVPIIMIDMSLSAPVMITIGSAIRARFPRNWRIRLAIHR